MPEITFQWSSGIHKSLIQACTDWEQDESLHNHNTRLLRHFHKGVFDFTCTSSLTMKG